MPLSVPIPDFFEGNNKVIHNILGIEAVLNETDNPETSRRRIVAGLLKDNLQAYSEELQSLGVNRVLLFGSTVTDKCTTESDIDVTVSFGFDRDNRIPENRRRVSESINTIFHKAAETTGAVVMTNNPDDYWHIINWARKNVPNFDPSQMSGENQGIAELVASGKILLIHLNIHNPYDSDHEWPSYINDREFQILWQRT